MPYDALRHQALGDPESHRLPKLYRAAIADGNAPRPERRSYVLGARNGTRDALRAISESLKPSELAKHLDAQYTFGYYDGVLSALQDWVRQLEGERREIEAARVPKRAEPATTEGARPLSGASVQRERGVLEKTIQLLCEHVEGLIREGSLLGRLDTREAELQIAAFGERKVNALNLCASSSDEPWEIRGCRYEERVAALDCSREFFKGVLPAKSHSVSSD